MHNGRLDVLVLNAAASTHIGTQLEISERRYDRMWEVNVKSVFFHIKECYPMLKKSKAEGGAANVLVISSMGGQNPHSFMGVYCMTKAALDNMVKSLSVELMPDGIRINSLPSGLIDTTFASWILKSNSVAKNAIG